MLTKKGQQNHWCKHNEVCVDDPRADLPNARQLALQDLQKRKQADIKDYDFNTDVNRYKKIFKSNYLQLLARTGATHHIDSSDKFSYLHWISAQELPGGIRDNEFYAKLDSNNSVTSARMLNFDHFTLDHLLSMANQSLASLHFKDARKFFTYAIDKIQMDNCVEELSSAQKARLIKLFAKRAQCNLELARMRNSVPNADKCVEDCAYVLQTGLFEKSTLEANSDVCQQMKLFKEQAQHLKAQLLAGNRVEVQSQAGLSNAKWFRVF